MKRAFTTSKPHICSLVASLFISTLLIELTPIGPPALASEIGANDFRISDMGPDGDANFDAEGYWFYGETAVAYNSNADEYLVVWMGDDGSGAQVDDEFEIYGQRLDALTGAEVGPNDFRISDMGPDGDANFQGRIPAVAYNPNANEYLVVWTGGERSAESAFGDFEVYGQRIDAITGAEVGPNDFRISGMGPDGNADHLTAFFAEVVYNANADEYLVVWMGDDGSGAPAFGDSEIYGQRLDGSTGAEVGPNDFRISDMGPDGDSSFFALSPALAYNSNADEYLVVWWGHDSDQTRRIHGQRLDGSTGAEIGINDFRITDEFFQADFPAVAYNASADEYLVVWGGGGPGGPGTDPEWEIYGQRLDGSTGAEIGFDDLRISDMGPDGTTNVGAEKPAVTYNPSADEYLVVWNGDADTGSVYDGESEIYGQRLDGSTGLEIGANDFRISDMGPDGDTAFRAAHPALPTNPRSDEYLVIWEGDDDTGTLVDDEVEIFGQLIYIPEPSRSSMLVAGAAFLGLLYRRRARALRWAPRC
jgi:hypothetical protein